MKNIITLSSFLYIVLLVWGCASYSTGNNRLPKVLASTQQTMTDLAVKIPATKNDSLIKAYDLLVEKKNELFPLLIKCNEKYSLSKSYINTLQAAQASLQRLHDAFDTVENRRFILDAVYRDYDAKVTSIQNSPTNEATTTIRVIVDSSEEDGFFVFGKLSYEQSLDIKRFRFNRPTQNAIQDFVPGYYLFWLEKDELVGEPELHLIRSNGIELEKKLVLKTPK